MEIKYNEKTVKIVDAENWVFDEVSADKIKTLNPELYKELQAKVENYIINKDEIEKREKEREEKALIERRTEEVEAFKKSFNDEFGELVENYYVEFESPNGRNYNFNAKRVKIKPYEKSYNSVEIKYDNKVYRSGSWHASTTNRVWELEDFDYKHKRYVKLESAVKKAIEVIKEKIADDLRKKERKNVQENEEAILKKYAEDNGFEFDKVYHRSKYNYDYYDYKMKNDKVIVNISYDRENKVVKLLSYTVSKNILLDDIKRI